MSFGGQKERQSLKMSKGALIAIDLQHAVFEHSTVGLQWPTK